MEAADGFVNNASFVKYIMQFDFVKYLKGFPVMFDKGIKEEKEEKKEDEEERNDENV